MSARAIFAPPTDLDELAGLLRRASLVVAADTGPLHLAAALGTPCVGLYGPTRAARNGPYGARCRALQSPDGAMAEPRSRRGVHRGAGSARVRCPRVSRRLTVTIVAWNEEERLRACLESVAWADEIVVVDAESTDKTAALAREFTDRVWVRPWPGFAVQKNFAIEQATGDVDPVARRRRARHAGARGSHPRDRRRPRAGRRLLDPAQEHLLGRLGAPRRPLSRLPAPAVPPGRGTLRRRMPSTSR